MYRYHCLNPISSVGLEHFPAKYESTDNMSDADAVLVRSANMHEMELPKNVVAIARAGAGVNNIPLEECAKDGVVVFNTCLLYTSGTDINAKTVCGCSIFIIC